MTLTVKPASPVQDAFTDLALGQLPAARQHDHICYQLECIDNLLAWLWTCRWLIGHG